MSPHQLTDHTTLAALALIGLVISYTIAGIARGWRSVKRKRAKYYDHTTGAKK